VRRDKKSFDESEKSWREHVQKYVRNPFLKNPLLFIEDALFRGHIYLDAEKFASTLIPAWSEPFLEEFYTSHLLRNRMGNEIFKEVTPVILHEDDLNAMYFSI